MDNDTDIADISGQGHGHRGHQWTRTRTPVDKDTDIADISGQGLGHRGHQWTRTRKSRTSVDKDTDIADISGQGHGHRGHQWTRTRTSVDNDTDISGQGHGHQQGLRKMAFNLSHLALQVVNVVSESLNDIFAQLKCNATSF